MSVKEDQQDRFLAPTAQPTTKLTPQFKSRITSDEPLLLSHVLPKIFLTSEFIAGLRHATSCSSVFVSYPGPIPTIWLDERDAKKVFAP